MQYFFIFVASVDPLSKNKSRIIIQKCRTFCKQLTLPGRTVQQLPFFKTVRLYTVVFEKGAKSKPENYRPISLTCILSKVPEHVIVSSIMNHLDNHNLLLYPLQHGFNSKVSCETQLLRNRPFNLKGGLWFFVSFRIFFSDNTRGRIFFLSR